MRLAWTAGSVLALAALAAACGGSDDGPPTGATSPAASGGAPEQPDCRASTDHVPYEVRLPTYLPYNIKLVGACYDEYNLDPGLPLVGVATLSYSSDDESTGFFLSTVPTELGTQGMTPVELAGVQAYFQREPIPDGERYTLQVTLDGVTYTIVGAVTPGSKITEEDLIRIAESIAAAD